MLAGVLTSDLFSAKRIPLTVTAPLFLKTAPFAIVRVTSSPDLAPTAMVASEFCRSVTAAGSFPFASMVCFPIAVISLTALPSALTMARAASRAM